MTEPLKLAEILCARLCHDLSGSIGTLTSSLEIIAEGGEDAAEALEIAQEAARGLQARLRYARASWAPAGLELNVTELLEFAASMPQARKLTLHSDDLHGPFGAEMARALLNLLQLAAEALPRGGNIRLSGSERNGVMVTIDGVHAAWPAVLDVALKSEEMAWSSLHDSRSLQSPLTALIALHSGLRLRFLLDGNQALVPPPLLLAHR